MVVIRLARLGAKKRPFYRIVATDRRRRRDSGSIQTLGYYNPVARGNEVRLHMDLEKVKHWESVGAQFSERVLSLYKEYQQGQKQAAKA